MIEAMLSDEQESLAASIQLVVGRHYDREARDATPQLWRALADIGILGLCGPDLGGSPLDLVAGMEALGRVGCPGPVVAAAASSLVLTGDDLDAVAGGERRVTLTDGRFVPWADGADFVLLLADDGAWRVEPNGLTPVATLSGEPWSMTEGVQRVERLADATGMRALSELALAAYLSGAAIALVERAAEHARARVQFGRPIGDFQAVAHPLARAYAEVLATQELVRMIARRPLWEAGAAPDAEAAKVQMARVARDAGDRVHQAFGAMGFARETGVAGVTTRIRQWAALPITARPSSGSRVTA
jgi:alkylation response protein AidB-like acyl-CoA dehydrogenase